MVHECFAKRFLNVWFCARLCPFCSLALVQSCFPKFIKKTRLYINFELWRYYRKGGAARTCRTLAGARWTPRRQKTSRNAWSHSAALRAVSTHSLLISNYRQLTLIASKQGALQKGSMYIWKHFIFRNDGLSFWLGWAIFSKIKMNNKLVTSQARFNILNLWVDHV